MIKNDKAIRADVNIQDVIGQYVTLKSRGTVLTGLCPFHNEKSPSFTVYPHTNTFKCFGCGEGGDAIHFLMEKEGMTYPEAIVAAAQASKIEVEYENATNNKEFMDREKAAQAHRQKLQDLLFNAHKYYEKTGTLISFCHNPKRGEGTTYVSADGRELKQDTAEAFGMCQSSKESLLAAIWEEADLMEIGLLSKGDYGTYDFFRNRLLFRITDHRGRPVGLAGRRLREDDAANKRAKYLNPKESILYKKTDVLFGLSENRKGIRDAGMATLVEGYFDVITPYDYGNRTMVAPCGTALTNEQASTLKRYTDEVIILRDGDDAGLEAAKRDVEILVRAGLKVRVALLKAPKALTDNKARQEANIEEQIKENAQPGLDDKAKKRGEKLLKGMYEMMDHINADIAAFKDPDAFFRRMGKDSYDMWIAENNKDGIIWRIMLEVGDNKDDVFRRDAATQVAANLLSLIENETIREFYVRELCKASNLGSIKNVLTGLIKTQVETKGSRSELTNKQKQDVIKYGIYELHHKYFICSHISGDGWCVSNFTIKPIIFIEGAKESIRLVEVTNEMKAAKILDINSRNFVELGPFKQTIESRGNYRFEGKPEHFGKVKAKVYDEMRTAYPIYTLGLHKEGFFTFANGIIDNGKFHPVDEYGLVTHNQTRYYLPAFSKIRDHIKSDDVDNDYQDEQYYVYTEGGAPVTFEEWTELMVKVHGQNAIIGILYLCSTIIRDKVFERLDNMFPHLNMFGLPGSGKNQLAASLCALFGKYRPPVHIINATDAAFFRRIAQIRNGLAWYDEYSNNAEHKRVEALKQFADGTGRSRASMDNPNRTNSSQVNSGVILSGQQQPTADVALFTRCISLNFSNTEYDQAAKDNHQRLKKMEQGGQFTDYVLQLHHHRPAMLEGFHMQFEDSYKRMADLLAGNPVMDRIVRSYTAMLTVYELLQEKMKFSFSKEQVEQCLLKSILTQKESVYQENEVSIWWRMVEFFLANGEVAHNEDILVESASDETFDLDWNGKNREVKAYKPAKRLLYIYLARVHPLYLERHQRQRSAKGLDMEALKYYLKASPAWEGFKKAKKIGGVTKRCLVFDVDKLPWEVEDTIAVLARKNKEKKDNSEENDEKSNNDEKSSKQEAAVVEVMEIPKLPF